MTKNKIFDVRKHSFSNSDAFLVDANIWLYLYGPGGTPTSWTAMTYSGVFARILSAGCSLFLDVLVLSEFINRFARLEMRRLKWASDKFKDFRQSAEYPPVAKSIEEQVNQILIACQPVDHPFSEWNINDLLKDFSGGSLDWNDQLIAENCRNNGFSLLTHDGDFTEGGISVFTANKRLLTA